MSSPVTAYMASDKTLFLSEKECDKYEMQLEKVSVIKKFVTGPSNTLRGKVADDKLIDLIGFWEDWQKTQVSTGEKT